MRVDIVDAFGNKRSVKSAENIAANTRFGVQRALFFTGKDLQAEFNRQVLARNKSGNLYIIRGRKRKRRHRASAKGETPANITGKYRKGIGFKVRGANELVFGNSTEYAGFLELGTSRMKPRPGLANTIKAGERDIIRNLSNGIEKAL